MPERHNVSIPCDLTVMQLDQAVHALFIEHSDAPHVLIVHPYAKQLAESFVYTTGWRQISVLVDPAFDEDAWCLRGQKHEIYSEGA